VGASGGGTASPWQSHRILQPLENLHCRCPPFRDNGPQSHARQGHPSVSHIGHFRPLEKFVMSSPAFPRQPGFATQIQHPSVNPILGSPRHVRRSVPPAAESIHPAPFNFPPQRIGDDFRCSALYAKAMPLKGVHQVGDGRRTVQPQLPGQHIPKLDSAEAHGRGHDGTVAWWYPARTSVCAQASCRGKAGGQTLPFPGAGKAHAMRTIRRSAPITCRGKAGKLPLTFPGAGKAHAMRNHPPQRANHLSRKGGQTSTRLPHGDACDYAIESTIPSRMSCSLTTNSEMPAREPNSRANS
jgi:hypothetical protein